MAAEHQCITVMVMMVMLWAPPATSLHQSPKAKLSFSELATTHVLQEKANCTDGLSKSLPGALREKSRLSSNLTKEYEAFDTPRVSQESFTLSSELRKHGKLHNTSELCWNDSSIPPPLCSNYSNNYNVTFNRSLPCYFSCTYQPNKKWPIRLNLKLNYKHPASHPTFIVVQQTYNITSWTLPITFPALGNDQKFTSLQATLCPPWHWGERIEVVSVRLTTESATMASLQVSVKQDQNFELRKTQNETVIASPASPWYKLYSWEDGEQSILVTADSVDRKSSNVCTLLLLQNARCPVRADVPKLQTGQIRYQTFTQRGSMVARRDQYPDGVFIIVRALPDDTLCTIKSEHSNKTHRSKSVVLEVWSHGMFVDSWYVFVAASVVVIAVAAGLAVISIQCIERTLGAEISNEEREGLLSESGESSGSGSIRVEERGEVLFGRIGTRSAQTQNLPNNPGGGSSSISGRDGGGQRGEIGGLSINLDNRPLLPDGGLLELENDGEGMEIASGPAPYPLPTTFTPHTSLMNFTNSLNPLYVMWWKRVAVFQMDTADFQVSEVGFQNNVIIMALYAALPTTELLRSYLSMLMNQGMEDQCFFNYRCLTALGTLPDFTRVFTNIGYVFVGAAYLLILRKHQQLTQAILRKYTSISTVGVTRHYGLFTSLGYGLIIQGIMSGLYHTCPNKVTIRIDMMFMYILLVVCVVNVWGLRHGDVTHHVYPTTVGVGVALLLADLRDWTSSQVFWSIFTVLYCVVLIPNTVIMARYGIWSFSPNKMWHVWKEWRPVMQKLEEMIQQSVVKEADQVSTPLQILRVVIGLVANIVLITCGIVLDPNVYTFILVVCLTNTGLYFLNYIIAKRIVYREKGTVLAWVCLTISLVLWIFALLAFFAHNSDSESSPSSSRALNAPCVMLGVFDYHDIWHIASAFGLGFFFIGLLTLDDDLCTTLSEKIHVF